MKWDLKSMTLSKFLRVSRDHVSVDKVDNLRTENLIIDLKLRIKQHWLN